MEFVTHGITRVVFLSRRFAFKVPNFGWSDGKWWAHLRFRGVEANRREARMGRNADPRLCPVVFALPFGLLVVMRRARPVTGAEFLEMPDDAYRLSHTSDVKPDNFGVLDGRVVWVDYG